MAGTKRASQEIEWAKHMVRAGAHIVSTADDPDPETHRTHVEPWLSALFQAEHLNLLVGSGFTTGVATAADAPATDMGRAELKCGHADAVEKAAKTSAAHLGRGEPNIEDQVRAVRDLIAGLRVLAGGSSEADDDSSIVNMAGRLLPEWESALDDILRSFAEKILATESGIDKLLRAAEEEKADQADRLRALLGGMVLPFASRAATRERLHIFTVNYDRLIEYTCDLLGIHVIDRFVGKLAPVFRTSRLGLDLHFNPPGIRGEPRYLEGVVRLTKLHGSVDWRREVGASGTLEVRRRALPFGADRKHPEFPSEPAASLLIYPNPAKDTETLEYPYAELFRDFAAAACQPNSVVVTCGYGFGDDHVNRILRDMLSLPSTHLAILSYDDAGGRLRTFVQGVGRYEQLTCLVGPHFGNLETLAQYYLPKPAIDLTTARMMELLGRRARPPMDTGKEAKPDDKDISTHDVGAE